MSSLLADGIKRLGRYRVPMAGESGTALWVCPACARGYDLEVDAHDEFEELSAVCKNCLEEMEGLVEAHQQTWVQGPIRGGGEATQSERSVALPLRWEVSRIYCRLHGEECYYRPDCLVHQLAFLARRFY